MMKLITFASLIAAALCMSDQEVVQQAKLLFMKQHGGVFPASLATPAVPTRADFEDFKRTYNKHYADSDEENRRFNIFRTNVVIAQALTETDQGTAQYGVTKFADLSAQEFKAEFLGLDATATQVSKAADAQIPSGQPPASVDWRKKGAVTPVRNQESCGSCWAFSTVENVEGQWFLAKGELVTLSVQELVDCDKVDQGCNGGLMTNGFAAIERLGGLEPAKDYPYHASAGPCKLNKSEIVAHINGFVQLPRDENQLAAWCAAHGPIANGINAANMQNYISGIAHPRTYQCNPNQLDHGVLIVGYGNENNTPFWIIKNSWGTNWGEQGYYRIFRGGGVCGMNLMCSSSTVKK